MKKDRQYDKVIVARVNATLKAKHDLYCEKQGIGASEEIRCHILNLPDIEGVAGLEAEYTRQIEDWTKKRDALRTTTAAARGDGAEGQGEEA